jgi:fatty acid desaturase
MIAFEHQPWSVDRPVTDDESIEPMTRSIRSSAIERIFFAPLNFNLHLEHDLFPEIPYHGLPAVHRELAAMGYFDREKDRPYEGGYIRLLRDLAFPKLSWAHAPANAR